MHAHACTDGANAALCPRAWASCPPIHACRNGGDGYGHTWSQPAHLWRVLRPRLRAGSDPKAGGRRGRWGPVGTRALLRQRPSARAALRHLLSGGAAPTGAKQPSQQLAGRLRRRLRVNNSTGRALMPPRHHSYAKPPALCCGFRAASRAHGRCTCQ